MGRFVFLTVSVSVFGLEGIMQYFLSLLLRIVLLVITILMWLIIAKGKELIRREGKIKKIDFFGSC